MLEKLLKEYLADDSKVSEFLEKMKESKIFLSKEENIDTRYTKMKGEYEAEKAEYAKALKLIETLKAQTQGQDALQTQITNYEQEISDLKANNEQLTRENNLKVALLSGKAKAEDIDYLLFKLSKDENAVKYGENGEVSNVNEITPIKDLVLPLCIFPSIIKGLSSILSSFSTVSITQFNVFSL